MTAPTLARDLRSQAAPNPTPRFVSCPQPAPGQYGCMTEYMPLSSIGASGAYSPQQLAQAYRVPANGTTMTVGIVDAYGDPTLISDLATWRQHFGLPSAAIDVVNSAGQASPLPAVPATTAGADWSTEQSIDAEAVATSCPTCHLLVVETDGTGSSLVAGIGTAADLGAQVISLSWGGPESATETSTDQSLFDSLIAKGVALVASDGDRGYGTAWPAASPDVLSVGGTTLSYTPGGWSNSVWSQSGSGCSSIEPQPTWQAQLPAIRAACSGRAENDVAADADPTTGLQALAAGKWVAAGGTSLAAPLVAGMVAVAGGPSPSTPEPSVVYRHRSDFQPVGAGSDGSCSPSILCTATPSGWSGPGGVGVPDGVAGFDPAAPDQPTTAPASATAPACNQALPAGTIVGAAQTPDGRGYWIAASTGQVAACGDATPLGSGPSGVAAIAATTNGFGYWLVTTGGAVYSFGTAPYYGGMGGSHLNRPIIAMAEDPATGGYWLLGGDGGVFSFHAPFYGSTGGMRLNQPAIGMQATPDGGGYRFVASDGGIFDFGDATFHGSMGGQRLNAPVVAVADDPATGGYWLLGGDGGVFSFDAPFYGSTGSMRLNQPAIGMQATPDGGGYRFVASDGGIFDFGDATFYGSGA